MKLMFPRDWQRRADWVHGWGSVFKSVLVSHTFNVGLRETFSLASKHSFVPARSPPVMITPKWLRKGARIEVLTENEWWEAVAGTIKQNFVRISYVGGLCPSLNVLAASMGVFQFSMLAAQSAVCAPAAAPSSSS